MPRTGLILGTAAVLALAWLVSGVVPGPGATSLPPMLDGVEAHVGGTDICEIRTQEQARGRVRTGASGGANLTERLSRAYPPGSEEGGLVDTLVGMGFTRPSQVCPDVEGVRVSVFRQAAEPSVETPMFVAVVWRVEDGRLSWVKGNVAFAAR